MPKPLHDRGLPGKPTAAGHMAGRRRRSQAPARRWMSANGALRGGGSMLAATAPGSGLPSAPRTGTRAPKALPLGFFGVDVKGGCGGRSSCGAPEWLIIATEAVGPFSERFCFIISAARGQDERRDNTDIKWLLGSLTRGGQILLPGSCIAHTAPVLPCRCTPQPQPAVLSLSAPFCPVLRCKKPADCRVRQENTAWTPKPS